MGEIKSPGIESKLALSAVNSDDGKVVKIKTPGEKTVSTTARLKVTDQLFLDTVRDDVYRKLRAGDFDLSLNDGFKSIDLKNKITTPEPDNRLAMLLEELRKELLR